MVPTFCRHQLLLFLQSLHRLRLLAPFLQRSRHLRQPSRQLQPLFPLVARQLRQRLVPDLQT